MSISEQVKELRELADGYKMADRPLAANTIYHAADTIESLSAKLQAANMERSADCGGGWIPCKERLPHILVMEKHFTQRNVEVVVL